MQSSDSPRRYPLGIIALHWTIALAMVGLVALGWWMQTIPKEPVGPRADAYNLHKSIGLAALLLTAVFVAWRATHQPPLLPSMPRWQGRAAIAGHVLVYAAMIVAAASGYLGSATSGYPVKFFGWMLPSWTGASPMVKDACSVVHLVSNWVLVGAIGLHVGATFYHQLILRDGLLWRMWPRTERARRRPVAARSPG
jgi:cytochrome b561